MIESRREMLVGGARTAPLRVLDTFRAAAGLLTRIPVRRLPMDTTGAAVFPIVGAAIGLGGAAACWLLGAAEPTLAAVLAVGAMTLASGALHLDGLADTADALLAPDPARAEQARTDPAIGAGGVVAIALVLAVQVAALASLTAGSTSVGLAGWACIGAAAAARLVPVLGARLGRTRAGDRGFGAWFIEHVGTADTVIAIIATVGVTAILGIATRTPSLSAGIVAGVAVGGAILATVADRRGRLDGDGFGASVEWTVAAILAATAILTA